MIKKGFTLVELITVIAILGIIIYITSFNNNIDTYLTLQNELLSIKDDINYIRKESMHNNRPFKIILYDNENYYDIEKLDEYQNQVIERIYLSSKFRFDISSNYVHKIEFTRSGTLSESGYTSTGAGTFYLKYKNKECKFTVLVTTGFVDIKKE